MKVLLAIVVFAALLSLVPPAKAADPTCVSGGSLFGVCVWNAVNPAETVDYVNCMYDNVTPNNLIPPELHIRDCADDWYVHAECHVLGADCRDVV